MDNKSTTENIFDQFAYGQECTLILFWDVGQLATYLLMF